MAPEPVPIPPSVQRLFHLASLAQSGVSPPPAADWSMSWEEGWSSQDEAALRVGHHREQRQFVRHQVVTSSGNQGTTMANRKHRSLRAITNAKFADHRTDMAFHRFSGNNELISNLAIGQAFRQGGQHIAFPL